MAKAAHVQVRRVYDPPEANDGQRVLVDRLWPRGLSKERAHLDDWCKDIAPSNELRKWYGHDLDRYAEFAIPSEPPRWPTFASWPVRDGSPC
jgi:uncharacterized protein YeaO (DUF488 family)